MTTYARRWDDAMEACLQYELSRISANWDRFDNLMQATGRLCFWKGGITNTHSHPMGDGGTHAGLEMVSSSVSCSLV